MASCSCRLQPTWTFSQRRRCVSLQSRLLLDDEISCHRCRVHITSEEVSSWCCRRIERVGDSRHTRRPCSLVDDRGRSRRWFHRSRELPGHTDRPSSEHETRLAERAGAHSDSVTQEVCHEEEICICCTAVHCHHSYCCHHCLLAGPRRQTARHG